MALRNPATVAMAAVHLAATVARAYKLT